MVEKEFIEFAVLEVSGVLEDVAGLFNCLTTRSATVSASTSYLSLGCPTVSFG
ncbi:hypothetical protein [Aquimarina sp. MMG016]|uniref:hypothetical protein n=1 Tax=Aquimarina sp. MMG016 TaxID=2822690 RepID=UPI001B3A4AAA|nr:hypothetical protein [Aquimarina sp. MMG016]MBQ4818575.1 hypothetical protein [Aquimarina sp. MMG016]